MASITGYTQTKADELLGAKADTADLGSAALMDVGTTTGTVMAGDDSRVTSLSSTYAALAPRPLAPRDYGIQNYIYDAGTVIDSGDSTAAWTLSGTGTLTDDTTYYRTGGHALRMTTTAGPFLQIDKTISVNFGTQPTLQFWVYLHDNNVQSMTVYITSAGLGTSYFLGTLDPVALWWTVGAWNLATFSNINTGWANTGGESWAATMTKIRIKVNAKTGTLPVVTVDDVRYNPTVAPKVLFTFDDAHHSVYDKAYPIMRERNLPGVIYVNGARIGTANYMTLDQCHELHAAGWDIASHGYAHINYAGLGQAAVQADMQANIDYLETNGFARGARHFAIPNSIYNADVRAAAVAVGMLTMRRAGNRTFFPVGADLLSLSSRTVLNTTPLATLTGWIDNAHTERSTAWLMFHQVADVAADTYDIATADFQAVVDHIYDNVLEDSVCTASRWWRCLNR